MRFEIAHEFDAPLDAVELAVLSPHLGSMLARSLVSAASATASMASIESVETVEHVLEGGELRRVLRFQASAPLPLFKGHAVARESMAWDEHSTYRLATHSSQWTVLPRREWRRYVRSEGTYRLERIEGGRTRRVVSGEIEVKLAVLGHFVERMAIAEVKKTYDAEAETLRELATL